MKTNFLPGLAKILRFLANTRRGFAENTREHAARLKREAYSNPGHKDSLLTSAVECEEIAAESEALALKLETKAMRWEALAAR
jgi:hypothetical protein